MSINGLLLSIDDQYTVTVYAKPTPLHEVASARYVFKGCLRGPTRCRLKRAYAKAYATYAVCMGAYASGISSLLEFHFI